MNGTVNRQVELVRSGYDYFERLEHLLRLAQREVYLQTYIFAEDDTGLRVTYALEQAAQRGVQVYLLADGYASQGLSDAWMERINKAGIQFRYFAPLWKSRYFYFGRRLHHKVLVVDGLHALVGGINISDHYNDTPGHSAWLDWALYVTGPAAMQLEDICVRRARGLASANLLHWPRAYLPTDPLIGVRVNDWVRGKREITHMYTRMLRQATKSVMLLSSYFLPGASFRTQLLRAARRGVKIRIIVAGISDVVIAKYAERYMYRWLLKNNIEIYEYQRNVLHGKVAVCDGRWCTVGSYNLNNISARASIELNLEVHLPELAVTMEQQLQQIIARDCVQITAQRYQHLTRWYQRFLQRSAYDIFRIGLFVFTFYFRKRE
ncbi:MAG: phospholipase D-like domain-containing protein [Bacteroidota bacterium]